MSMDPNTLEALRGSIAKWQAIVDGTGKDRGILNCPLCQLFHSGCRDDGVNGCTGCPVRQATGQRGCMGSPYELYYSAQEAGAKDAMRKHAVEELAFLKTLLPPGVDS